MPSSTIDQNKALVQQIIDRAWNHGDLTLLEPPFGPDDRTLDPSRHRQSGEQMRQAVALWRALAPDLHVTIEQVLAEGDAVMARWTAHGTHTGTVAGEATADLLRRPDDRFHLRLLTTIHPTGRRLSFDGVTVLRIVNGTVLSVWLLFDEIKVLRQLGAMPTAP